MVASSIACGSSEPRTDAERLARGREIVERMSAKLGAAQQFGLTVTEVRDEVNAKGTASQAGSCSSSSTTRYPGPRSYGDAFPDRRATASRRRP